MNLARRFIKIDTSDFYNAGKIKSPFFGLQKIKSMIAAYLTFNGTTEEAFKFYKSVLGGELTSVQRFGDTPHGEHMPDSDKKKIMHITLESEQGTIMGNDHMDFMGPFQAGNNFSLSVHPKTEEEAKKLFEGLSQGGNVIMPLDKVFWGAYFGMLVDKFGIKWMVNYQPNQ
jgi:PhnB protein